MRTGRFAVSTGLRLPQRVDHLGGDTRGGSNPLDPRDRVFEDVQIRHVTCLALISLG